MKPYSETQMVVNVRRTSPGDDFTETLIEAAQRCAERVGDIPGGFVVMAWDDSGSFRQCAFMNGSSVPADLLPDMVANTIKQGMIE